MSGPFRDGKQADGKTFLTLRGLPVRYVRLLTLGRFEIALTWLAARSPSRTEQP